MLDWQALWLHALIPQQQQNKYINAGNKKMCEHVPHGIKQVQTCGCAQPTLHSNKIKLNWLGRFTHKNKNVLSKIQVTLQLD